MNRASTSVLAVLDREYGNASWVLALAQASILADCLMRVRKNAGLWSAPPAYSGRGRPRKHGQKMRLNDPTTWLEADTAIEIDEHPELGQVRVRQWLDLHFYRAPGQRVNLILALKNEAHVKWSAVSTLMVGLGGRTNSTQVKQSGSNIYDVLDAIVGIGLHLQRLHWTLPNLRTPEQSPALE
ncbi:transposase [Microcoleus sp. AT9_B5]